MVSGIQPIMGAAWFSDQPHLLKVYPSYVKYPVLVLKYSDDLVFSRPHASVRSTPAFPSTPGKTKAISWFQGKGTARRSYENPFSHVKLSAYFKLFSFLPLYLFADTEGHKCPIEGRCWESKATDISLHCKTMPAGPRLNMRTSGWNMSWGLAIHNRGSTLFQSYTLLTPQLRNEEKSHENFPRCLCLPFRRIVRLA